MPQFPARGWIRRLLMGSHLSLTFVPSYLHRWVTGLKVGSLFPGDV